MDLIFSLLFVFVLLILYLFSSIKVLAEYERGVVFRLGRLLDKPKGPGLIFVFWPIDRMQRVSLRTITLDVPPQDVITRDNVTVSVNAVVYFRVIDASRAVVDVENYLYATSQLAQTTLRSVLGEYELDDLLANREQLNDRLQSILDHQTDPWGIKVSLVEVKTVDLPQAMQRAMSKQAEAEREKRAKFIHAQGELQASQMLLEAAQRISQEPTAIQLRYLQTLTEIGVEKNTTVVFPIPMNLMEAFGRPGQAEERPRAAELPKEAALPAPEPQRTLSSGAAEVADSTEAAPTVEPAENPAT
jgi:regulator of protease activity HflC (stomatin/prohibitin superfamily)